MLKEIYKKIPPVNPETKRTLQIHHEAILTHIGLVGGGCGLLSGSVQATSSVINGPEYAIKTIESAYSNYKRMYLLT